MPNDSPTSHTAKLPAVSCSNNGREWDEDGEVSVAQAWRLVARAAGWQPLCSHSASSRAAMQGMQGSSVAKWLAVAVLAVLVVAVLTAPPPPHGLALHQDSARVRDCHCELGETTCASSNGRSTFDPREADPLCCVTGRYAFLTQAESRSVVFARTSSRLMFP